MAKRKIIQYLLVLAVLMPMFSHLRANDDAGQPGAFLRYGAGGRAMGMGQAFVALSDDASGMYWNPAGMLRVKRFEMVSMYTDLYYDSRYSCIGLVMPRLLLNPKNKIARFLAGPSAALGVSWVGYNTVGFEQRSVTGRYLGSFNFGENAFLLSWAREWAGDWGILRYGLTGKLINRQFPGLVADAERAMEAQDQLWTQGMDFGLTFQPIHAPIFRVFSLRYLLPLQFGFSIQNLVQPSWQPDDAQNKLPRLYRAGVSYKWILKDWIPKSWHAMYRLLETGQIIMAYDHETYGEISHHYFGLEGAFPILDSKVMWYPRWGINNRTQNKSVGAGIQIPFSRQGLVQVDYALGFHPVLKDDQRFFVTIKIGAEKGAELFRKMAKNRELNQEQAKGYLLRTIAEYPHQMASEAASAMLRYQDSTYLHRYYILTQGEVKATWLLSEAQLYLREGKTGKARKRAEDAVREYLPLFLQDDNPLSDNELLDYGEALIIAQKYEEANTVLSESDAGSIRQYFLQAVAYRGMGKLDQALDMYNKTIQDVENDQQDMALLSLLGLSEVLIQRYQYRAAMTSLTTLLNNYQNELDPEYPRYPDFPDNYVVDDAQFLLGICAARSGQHEAAVSHFMNVLRLYPELDYGKQIEVDAETLIHILEDENWESLQELAKKYLYLYQQTHEMQQIRID